jgi:hypothetical protein
MMRPFWLNTDFHSHKHILYFWLNKLCNPYFKRLPSIPSFHKRLGLSTQVFQLGIFNNFCEYFQF